MKVFLSWPGAKSLAVAKILEEYLPCFINSVQPWLSASGISSGEGWSPAIAANLEASNIGIICLTAENREAPWILFEAGAIAKQTADGRAMVLRIGLKTADVTGPLSQFQSIASDREGVFRMVVDINKAVPVPVREDALERTFGALWPDMEAELTDAAAQLQTPEVQQRSLEDMVRELLDLSRRQDAALQQLILPSQTTLGSFASGKSHRVFDDTNPGPVSWEDYGKQMRFDALRALAELSKPKTEKEPNVE